jgi:hypothetical protein
MRERTVGEVDPKVDRDELPEIVEEAARLAEEDASRVDAPEARRILEELDLPADRLEEARLAVALRRATARVRVRRRLAFAAGCALAALTAGAVALHHHAHEQAALAMTVTESSLTSHGSPITSPLSRAAAPEVVLNAVLAHAPRDEAADLTCDWTAPSGQLEHQSHWQTRPIDRDVWPTHCKHSFGATDTPGRWAVVMRQGGHELTRGNFSLE